MCPPKPPKPVEPAAPPAPPLKPPDPTEVGAEARAKQEETTTADKAKGLDGLRRIGAGLKL